MKDEDHPGKPPSSKGSGSPEDQDLARRLQSLDARLGEVSAKQETVRAAERSSGDRSGLGQAFRLSTEFMAGIIVGFGVGWAFDKALGTSPWGLIVFLLLGFGAAVVNVMRAAGMIKTRRG
jgi:ATP synthase protein I